jgi:hypothetical protein
MMLGIHAPAGVVKRASFPSKNQFCTRWLESRYLPRWSKQDLGFWMCNLNEDEWRWPIRGDCSDNIMESLYASHRESTDLKSLVLLKVRTLATLCFWLDRVSSISVFMLIDTNHIFWSRLLGVVSNWQRAAKVSNTIGDNGSASKGATEWNRSWILNKSRKERDSPWRKLVQACFWWAATELVVNSEVSHDVWSKKRKSFKESQI